MINLFAAAIESALPEYKIKLYYRTDKKEAWSILERHCLFFYKSLTHSKIVSRDTWARPFIKSHELLMFDSREAAETEIDRLGFGYSPITERAWHNGRLHSTTYADGNIWKEKNG
jgi:hypothetical protein